MTAAVQTFDPTHYFVYLYNAPIVQFAKGSFVTIAYDSPFWTDVIGANGDVARILSADRRATIKFTLQSDSPSNNVLDNAATSDERGGNNTTSVSCKDDRGTSIASGNKAWVVKKPDQQFSSTEATTRDWEIRVAHLVTTVGGR